MKRREFITLLEPLAARGGTRRRFSWGSGDWVRPAALLCEKCSYFRLRRVPEGVLAVS